MKKTLTLILAVVLCFMVCACGRSEMKEEDKNINKDNNGGNFFNNLIDPFWWFEVSPVEDDCILTVRADELSDVYVSSSPSKWVKDFTVSFPHVLEPVSCAFENPEDPSFYLENYRKATEDCYLSSEIWVKTDSVGKDLKLSFEYNSDVPQCLRVTLVDITNPENGCKVFSATGGVTEAYGEQQPLVNISHLPFGDLTLKDNLNGENQHYVVYLYYEGQDPSCNDSVQSYNISIKLLFSVE